MKEKKEVKGRMEIKKSMEVEERTVGGKRTTGYCNDDRNVTLKGLMVLV